MELRAAADPAIIYGTAWKEDRTEALTLAALEAGFRAVDTANQRRHYYEEGVGRALQAFLATGAASREELFIQTKFTFAAGQDHRLPYDRAAPVRDQVRQSFESSLRHLGVDYVDAFLLHGPSTYPGLGAMDREAWTAMEDLVRDGRVRGIGLSNVTAHQLELVAGDASVPPSFVQNRTFHRPHADEAVRSFCQSSRIVYEGFSLLTALPALLVHPVVGTASRRAAATAAQVVFAWARQRGIVPLTGTTSAVHMAEDLGTSNLRLQPTELAAIEALFA